MVKRRRCGYTVAMTEPLPLERDDEQARLLALLARVQGGGAGACVLVQGEPGVGKTSLLRWVRERTDPRLRWLWGACEPMLTPPPLSALIDMIEQLPPSMSAAVRSGRQMPELFAGWLALLRDAGGPAVLVIDDVQWADGATLELLRFIGRRIESTHALLVLLYRDDALASDHPLVGLLGALPPRACERFVLKPLSRAAVAELAQRAGRSARGLYRATQGNPFFVTELLAGDALHLPASVREAVLVRAAPLSAEARDALELVSVAPMQMEFEVLDALLEHADHAVAECTAAGLLQHEGTALHFRHEIARLAVESALPSSRATALHAAVFDALSLRDAPTARLVHHAAKAGLDLAVLRLAPVAAREAAAASAHRQAAALFALALAHGSALPASERAALCVEHAEECLLTNLVDAAMASRREALALHRELGDPVAEGMDLRALARIEWFRGSPQAGQPHAQAAIDVLEHSGARREYAMACATMAQLHLLGETSVPAYTWGLKALAMMEELGDAEGLTYVLNTVGTAELRNRDVPDAWQRLERSLAIALEQGFEEHAARAYTNLVSLGLVHRRYAQLEARCAEGIAYCVAHDLDMYLCRLRIRRAYGLIATGVWDEAQHELDQVRETAQLAPLETEQSAHVQALLALRRGDAMVDGYWAEMRAGSRALSIDPWYSPQAVARAEAAWLAGRDGEVRRIVAQSLPAAARSGEAWRIGQLACWSRRAGEVIATAESSLPVPCALERTGQWREAAAAWGRLGCGYEQALVLMGGDESGLREALVLLDGLGAAAPARIARRRLRALGAREVSRGPQPRTLDDALGLTTREREVFEHLLRGLSNAQIAARLHRSERTVEHHVAAVFTKLAVGSRAELIAAHGAARHPGKSRGPRIDTE